MLSLTVMYLEHVGSLLAAASSDLSDFTTEDTWFPEIISRILSSFLFISSCCFLISLIVSCRNINLCMKL